MAIAVALWCVHGVLLWRNRNQFRLQVALLHGLAAALPALALVWLGPRLGLPALLPLSAGIGLTIGLVGGKGHPLAPGLWFGNGLIWLLFATLPRAGAALPLSLLSAYALAAQMGLLLMGLTRTTRD